MQIGMATTVPTTSEEKEALTELALAIAKASKQAQKVTSTFKNTSTAVVTVEGRDLEVLLAAIARQITQVLEPVKSEA